MALVGIPETIRVKLSSEAADLISMTPVVVQQMRTEELIRLMLGAARKDADRLREILVRGSFVSGASRFRWESLTIEAEELRNYLARYPDPDPSRIFEWKFCRKVAFRGLTLSQDSASERRLLRRSSFWDRLVAMDVAARYIDYSYKEGMDLFRADLSVEQQADLREHTGLLRYASMAAQLRSGDLSRADIFLIR